MPVLQWPSAADTAGRARSGGAQNLLLAAIPEEVLQRLETNIERVQMAAGQVLCEPGVALRDVYFPVSAVVAMSFAMKNGSAAEVALIGREGLVGLPLLLGNAALNVRASVQSDGSGFKLPAQRLRDEFRRGGVLMQVLLGYTAFYIGQIVQTAACNRHGSLEQRLCRWLLLCLDRMRGNELTMTHEAIANALGVKREGVTEAACRLRGQGAIRYWRGHIEVLDRSILERQAREWYEIDPRRSDRESIHSFSGAGVL